VTATVGFIAPLCVGYRTDKHGMRMTIGAQQTRAGLPGGVAGQCKKTRASGFEGGIVSEVDRQLDLRGALVIGFRRSEAIHLVQVEAPVALFGCRRAREARKRVPWPRGVSRPNAA
jgi:hypothetical protein